MKEKETAAIYCRLSQDDGSVGESGSMVWIFKPSEIPYWQWSP